MERPSPLHTATLLTTFSLCFSSLAVNAQQAKHSAAVAQGYEMVKQSKCAEALIQFQSAANAGDAEAANVIGGLYDWGSSCPKVTRNFGTAAIWFKKAAELGNSRAMTSLADIYRTGKGVPQNIDLALEWDQKAEAAATTEGDELEKNVAHDSAAYDVVLTNNFTN